MIWAYALLSVFIISLISLIGIFTISINNKKLEKVLIYLISFSAGALFGDAFIHLLPEIVRNVGFTLSVSLYLLGGIVLFFIIEKIVHWNHCHMPITEKHVHPYSIMNLVGDGTHKCDDLSWFDLDDLPDNIILYIKQAINRIRDNIHYSEHGWSE